MLNKFIKKLLKQLDQEKINNYHVIKPSFLVCIKTKTKTYGIAIDNNPDLDEMLRCSDGNDFLIFRNSSTQIAVKRENIIEISIIK